MSRQFKRWICVGKIRKFSESLRFDEFFLSFYRFYKSLRFRDFSLLYSCFGRIGIDFCTFLKILRFDEFSGLIVDIKNHFDFTNFSSNCLVFMNSQFVLTDFSGHFVNVENPSIWRILCGFFHYIQKVLSYFSNISFWRFFSGSCFVSYPSWLPPKTQNQIGLGVT